MKVSSWQLAPLLVAIGCGGNVMNFGSTDDGGARGGAGGSTGAGPGSGGLGGKGAGGNEITTGAAAGSGQGGAGGSGAGGAPQCSPNAGQSIGLTMTNREYDNTVGDLLGYPGSASADFMFVEESSGFEFQRELANPLTQHRLAHYALAAEKIADFVVNRGLDQLLPCDPGLMAEEACARSFIRSFGLLAFRRPLTNAELGQFDGSYAANRATGTFAAAIRGVVFTALSSAPFYILEQPGASNQLARLSPYAFATRMSYFLRQTTPDRELLAAAADGTLSSAAGIEQQVRRLLTTPRGHAAMNDFFRQWLRLDRLDEITSMNPQFVATRDYMKKETLLFTDAVFFDGSPWSELLLGTKTFMNEPLAAIYGQPGIEGLDFRPVMVDPKVRMGLLTQASFLAINSSSDFGSPTKRGVFVRERLLCMQLPAPPPNSPPIPPSSSGTHRQRYEEATNMASCAGCHVLIDPIGFGFEHFDGIGRYLATDNSLPIDATGRVTSVEADLEGPFDGALELSRKLAASRDMRSCMAKQWLRFALSRSETEEDRCSIDAVAATLQRGGTLPNMVATLVASDAFQHARW